MISSDLVLDADAVSILFLFPACEFPSSFNTTQLYDYADADVECSSLFFPARPFISTPRDDPIIW